MEYRRLGKTNEKISTIGMGGWRIGTYHSEDGKKEQIRAIRKGLELGINLVDTAEMYGSGRSEQLYGEAIKDQRESVFIATKVSPENLAHDDLIRSCEASLKRLETKYVDLYQVHWPNSRIPIRETMAAMEELVRAGKVRYVGVSNFSVEQTTEATEALTKNDLASNQVEYSVTNQSVEQELLPFCRRKHITLIAYSPLARGNIPDGVASEALLRKYDMTRAQIMLNWVTRDENVVAIPKSGIVAHIEENAASVSLRFSDSEYEAISRLGQATL